MGRYFVCSPCRESLRPEDLLNDQLFGILNRIAARSGWPSVHRKSAALYFVSVSG